MNKNDFINLLRNAVKDFENTITSDDGNWVVKGFIDINKNIYTLSSDLLSDADSGSRRGAIGHPDGNPSGPAGNRKCLHVVQSNKRDKERRRR